MVSSLHPPLIFTAVYAFAVVRRLCVCVCVHWRFDGCYFVLRFLGCVVSILELWPRYLCHGWGRTVGPVFICWVCERAVSHKRRFGREVSRKIEQSNLSRSSRKNPTIAPTQEKSSQSNTPPRFSRKIKPITQISKIFEKESRHLRPKTFCSLARGWVSDMSKITSLLTVLDDPRIVSLDVQESEVTSSITSDSCTTGDTGFAYNSFQLSGIFILLFFPRYLLCILPYWLFCLLACWRAAASPLTRKLLKSSSRDAMYTRSK